MDKNYDRKREELDFLNSSDFEFKNFEKFKYWNDIPKESMEKAEKIMEYLRSVFSKTFEIVFWHMAFDIVRCPKCKNMQAYYFHGHKFSSGVKHVGATFHQDTFLLKCKNCGEEIKKHEDISTNRPHERVTFMPGTKIPLYPYTGIWVKNKSQT